jgi:hypothetical protein
MRKTTLIEDAAIKSAAQYLLREGLATYAEIAVLSGRSRQVVRLWAMELGAESARAERLEKLWRDALRQAR